MSAVQVLLVAAPPYVLYAVHQMWCTVCNEAIDVVWYGLYAVRHDDFRASFEDSVLDHNLVCSVSFAALAYLPLPLT